MRFQTISVFSLSLALSCIAARAQDPGTVEGIHRDAQGVDASVHASVDERPQTEPPHEASKRPTTRAGSYSHWGFASHDELTNTRFWPAPPLTPSAAPPAATDPGRAKDALRAPIAGGVSFRATGQSPASFAWPAPSSIPEVDPRTEGKFEKVELLPDPFQGLAAGWSLESAAQSLRFRTPVPRLALQPETSGWPAPFRQEPFASSGGLFNSPFPFFHSTLAARGDRAEANRRGNRPRKSPDEERAGSGAEIRGEREKADRTGQPNGAE